MRKAGWLAAGVGVALAALLLALNLRDDADVGDGEVGRDVEPGAPLSSARLQGRPSPRPVATPPVETADERVDPDAAAQPVAGFEDVFRLRVVDPDGAGVPDVRLRIGLMAPKGDVLPPSVRSALWQHNDVSTDAEGRVAIRGVNVVGGVATLHFASGPAEFVLPDDKRFAVSEEEAVVELERAAAISGRVVPDPAEPPPARVLLTAHWLRDGERRQSSAHVGDDGAFRVGALPGDAIVDLVATTIPSAPPGDVRFVVDGAERVLPSSVLPEQGPWFSLDSLPVAGCARGVAAGSRGVEVVLGEVDAFRFRAVDDEGKALGGTSFRFEPLDGSPMPPHRVHATAEGWVQANGLRPGAYRVVPRPAFVVTNGPKGPVHAPREVRVPLDEDRLVFRRLGAVELKGRLLGQGNLSGFRLSIRHPATDVHELALADAEGRFGCTVHAGTVDLRATRFGDPRSGHLRGVEAGAGEVEVDLEPGLEVRGRVLDVNGEPVNFAGWATAEGEQAFAATPVLPGGRFTFDALPRGRYTIRVGGGGPTSEAEVRDVEAGSRDVVVRLPERR